VWQKLPCLALQFSLRWFGVLIIHTLFQCEKKPTIPILTAVINLFRTKLLVLWSRWKCLSELLLSQSAELCRPLYYPRIPIPLVTGQKDSLLKHNNFNYMRRIYWQSFGSRTRLERIPFDIFNTKVRHSIRFCAQLILPTF
jgi:hypothetical protein